MPLLWRNKSLGNACFKSDEKEHLSLDAAKTNVVIIEGLDIQS
jgi:hypothetical protein